MEDIRINILKIEKGFLISLAVISLVGGVVFGYITAQIKNFSGIQIGRASCRERV